MSAKPAKWGSNPSCPACMKTVYPAEQVFAADRKPFHRGCNKCQVKGCGNELTARGMHKHEGYNFCDDCHQTLYQPKEYGPPPGMESLDERRARMAREQEERERKLKEIEEKKNSKDDFNECPHIYCIKIAEICEIAPEKSYAI